MATSCWCTMTYITKARINNLSAKKFGSITETYLITRALQILNLRTTEIKSLTMTLAGSLTFEGVWSRIKIEGFYVSLGVAF